MAYSSNHTNRASIFDAGDIIQGDHIKSIYDELGAAPGSAISTVNDLAPYAAGYWLSSVGGSLGSFLCLAGSMTLVPLLIGKETVSIDKAAITVVTGGSTGSVVRLGIYASTDGLPSGDPLADWGTQATTAASTPEWTFASPLTLTRGVYWLAAASQGAPTTEPTVRYSTTPTQPLAISTSAAGALSASTGLRMTGVTGALPPIASLTSFFTATAVAVRFV